MVQPCHNHQWEANTQRHQRSKHFIPCFRFLDTLRALSFCRQSRMLPFCEKTASHTSSDNQQGIDPGLPPAKIPPAHEQKQWYQEIHRNHTDPLASRTCLYRLLTSYFRSDIILQTAPESFTIPSYYYLFYRNQCRHYLYFILNDAPIRIFGCLASLFSRLNLDDLVAHHHIIQRRPFTAGIQGHFFDIEGQFIEMLQDEFTVQVDLDQAALIFDDIKMVEKGWR